MSRRPPHKHCLSASSLNSCNNVLSLGGSKGHNTLTMAALMQFSTTSSLSRHFFISPTISGEHSAKFILSYKRYSSTNLDIPDGSTSWQTPETEVATPVLKESMNEWSSPHAFSSSTVSWPLGGKFLNGRG